MQDEPDDTSVPDLSVEHMYDPVINIVESGPMSTTGARPSARNVPPTYRIETQGRSADSPWQQSFMTSGQGLGGYQSASTEDGAPLQQWSVSSGRAYQPLTRSDRESLQLTLSALASTDQLVEQYRAAPPEVAPVVSDVYLERQSAYCKALLKGQLNYEALNNFFVDLSEFEGKEPYEQKLTEQITQVWTDFRPCLATYTARAGGEGHLHVDWEGRFQNSNGERKVLYTIKVTKNFRQTLDTISYMLTEGVRRRLADLERAEENNRRRSV